MREQTKVKIGLVLDYVNEYIDENGYPPSVRDICSALGYKSTSTVHIYLKALERDGKILKAPSKPRTLRVMRPDTPDAARRDSAAPQNYAASAPAQKSAAGARTNGGTAAPRQNYPVRAALKEEREDTVYVPVVGRVTAGRPILAVENIEYTFPVPAFFVNNANVFMLKVEGDSMINAGIFDRDYILVRQQPTAQNGDIVVALIEDEATVKTFYAERNRIRLQPENERYSPIYATNNCQIVGKVVGIFRKI